MDCNEVKKNIPLYIDNKLTRNKKRQFKQHISACGNCKYEFETFTKIFKKYAELADVKVSEDLKDKIYENLFSLPVESASSLKNKLAELISKIKSKFYLIPKFSIPFKIAFITILILAFVLAGITHYRKNYQQKQNELLKIFERKPFLESTYDLSVEAQSLKLDYKMNNSVEGVQKKIVNLKTKHEEFLNFSNYDVEINKLKKRINKIKNENFFRRNSS